MRNFTVMKNKRLLIIAAAAVLAVVLAASVILGVRSCGIHTQSTPDVAPNLMYGIEYYDSDYVLETGEVKPGESISTIFDHYGVTPLMVDRTAKAAEGVFSLRNIRAGKGYTAFMSTDSIPELRHFVYEHTLTDYLVISYPGGDSITVKMESKDVEVWRKMASGTINSSLWNSMAAAGMPPALSMDLSDLYAWTIDFFGLQKGDSYTVIYDEKYVDSTSVGTGRIWGALFKHNGKEFFAIPFKQGARITYWDEKANSLRKSMLKAPLKFSRISSKFSNSRMHPVLRIRRPHHGVDYAAPSGTHVHAVADGTIIFKGWDRGGGGNTLKIRHASGLVTGYLHLRGFAPGIAQGKHVSQGDLIGYVGSTGTSTGPHLDYRVWKNGKAIDPLKITSEPAEPISAANKAKFELVRERVMAELRGELPDSLKITQLDSLEYIR